MELLAIIRMLADVWQKLSNIIIHSAFCERHREQASKIVKSKNLPHEAHLKKKKREEEGTVKKEEMSGKPKRETEMEDRERCPPLMCEESSPTNHQNFHHQWLETPPTMNEIAQGGEEKKEMGFGIHREPSWGEESWLNMQTDSPDWLRK